MQTERKQLKSGFVYFALNGKYLVSGQPGPMDIPLLKQEEEPLGLIINLREKEELEILDFRPEELMQAHNLSYSNIPLIAGGDFHLGNLDKISAALSSLKAEEKALIHCAAGQRAAVALTGFLVKSRQISKESAPQAAARLGLKKGELLQRLLDIL